MLQRILVILFCIFTSRQLIAQDSVVQRIIFIGDAGKIDAQQEGVLAAAAQQVIVGKTTVMFLGDNIYPRGMGLRGSAEETETQKILQAQFVPFRAKGAPVYFIPGNHDWDRMGREGLKKIKQQGLYLAQQQDSLLKMLPANGCPDPFELNISEEVTIIGFDSEWWLYPFSKTDEETECSCNSNEEIVERLEELLYKNRHKFILLASHHPFQSYGHHGGYYALKDHIFPLTSINKNLYIPLPVVGSLYPLLRKTFTNPEDMIHPLYKSMIEDISNVFEGFPNIVYVAGHEHGLQFIKNKHIQVVSGSGSKESFVKKGKHALFAETKPGFVTADVLPDNSIRFNYFVSEGEAAAVAFTYVQPYTNTAATTALQPIDQDSVWVQANPKYDSVGNLHRKIFGENYRKEWAAKTRVPVIHVSTINGGLIPTQRGGGHQSVSLRLEDKEGKEWVLRSVDKNPEVIIPAAIRQTFAKDIVQDNMSAQHPYSALIVPPLADALQVPHANPMIGLVSPDVNLGVYEKLFANRLCLLEEREPAGKSDNTVKMLEQLLKDNDNRFDSALYLRAKILDLFLGDWDRHFDQWRWHDIQKGNSKKYIAVPRDRDQALYVNEGFLPNAASRPWLLPYLQGFKGRIKDVNTFMYNGRQLSSQFLNQFDYETWMRISKESISKLTDEVLEDALQRLPESAKSIRYNQLLQQLKERRGNMEKAMSKYYRFVSKIVDIRTTNKNEYVEIKNGNDNNLQVNIYKLSKEKNIKEQLYSRTFLASETKEIRLFTGKGDDSVMINNATSPVKLRIVGGKGDKKYNIVAAARTIKLYGKKNNVVLEGDASNIQKHLSNDSLNTAYMPSDLYNVTGPVIAAGYNRDDGLLIGAGIKHVQRGFRKLPYGSMQLLSFTHSFSSGAWLVRYRGEWIQAIGKADVVLNGIVKAPNNTQNFYGLGNETPFNKTGDYVKYYRARFNIYQAEAWLRWRNKSAAFSVGPSFQYYHFNETKNAGRFITGTTLLHTYDSSTIAEDKYFAGATAQFVYDKRDSRILPSTGGYFNIRLAGQAGLNNYSKSFAQATSEFVIYKSLDRQSAFIIANRVGGGVTLGNAAFYQSLFLGGHENLQGYRQYRFAGDYMLYNNFELRIKLADIANYILPGQLGITGFYDIGRVWVNEFKSDQWHQGTGAGIYFAPAQMAVLQFTMGYSREGWYPYITLAVRY